MIGKIALITGAGVASSLAIPVALGVMGFTTAGIVAGSVASKMMSGAAIANGGSVAAGSLVALFQSIGAAGLSGTATVVTGVAGSVITAVIAF
ncbi:interferon alpha-inducible protein 27, mitochondrial-like [Narcine bancroftii]|uniref:interferon alpha-inducible protein 27, mitochondrial-like n=1 Tax=Narcine bancroftii TaxID=1343680 RepID=UPI0038316316